MASSDEPFNALLYLSFEPLMTLVYFLIGDCHDGHGLKDRCVTGAIYNYSMQLSQGYYDLNSEKCEEDCPSVLLMHLLDWS